MRRASIPPLLAALLLLIILAPVGCRGRSTGAPVTLKIGLLPIVDALPVYVADADGYFAEQKLTIEPVLFQSALERDSALLAGQLDLELNDLVSAALLDKGADRVRVVRLAYRGNPVRPMMVLLVGPSSKVTSAAELKGGTIAISTNTVIEYATDALLEGAGLAAGDVQKTEVTKIPLRVEMLVKGQVGAATLPEPMASLAVQQGARVLLDDGQSGVGVSVISARREVIESNADALRRFLVAYEKAVGQLNAEPERYRQLFAEKAQIPESLRATFSVPPYPPAEVPSQREVADVVDWMVRKGLLERTIGYESLVDRSLLPGAESPASR